MIQARDTAHGGGPPAVSAPGESARSLSDAAQTRSTTRRWRSAELFGGDTLIETEHGSAVYQLRLTPMGKLMLTKSRRFLFLR